MEISLLSHLAVQGEWHLSLGRRYYGALEDFHKKRALGFLQAPFLFALCCFKRFSTQTGADRLAEFRINDLGDMGLAVIIVLAQRLGCVAETDPELFACHKLIRLVQPLIDLFRCHPLGFSQGAKLFHFRSELGDQFYKAGRLGGRGPFQIVSFRPDTGFPHDFLHQAVDSKGIIITKLVMTFAKLSAACKDAVSSFQKTFEDKGGINPAGTHDADGTQVGWILIAGNTCGIGCRVAAPVAEKPENSGVEIFLTHILYLFGAGGRCSGAKGLNLGINLFSGKSAHGDGKGRAAG